MIDAALLSRLEKLNILARSAVAGSGFGRRLARRAGSSQEFHDYRHYASGDELRYLDWNVYARHESLFVKEFAAEENVHVAVALDSSASMGVGTPPKMEAAKQLGLALAYVGLCNFDSAGLFTVGKRLEAARPMTMGKGRIHEFLPDVERIRAHGETDLAAAFDSPLPKLRGRTVVLLVSDFLDVDGTPRAVKSLLSRRIQVHMIQILAPEDVEPSATGRLRLRDAETGREREIFVSRAALRGYRDAAQRYLAQLRDFAREREIRFARVASSDSLEDMIVSISRAGILERS
ncbi:MAG TPA: DUF58 domain-containing protein [Planctomycetota bacterium]|nr:DUF58 domain-containing protein [Planctomycetota bacterium]